MFEWITSGRVWLFLGISESATGISSYFSESETNVRLSGKLVRVEVGEWEECRINWSRVFDAWPKLDHERRRFGFEP
ncbi:hypothetical protein BDZ94DRAFT_1278339 [Collybia nuda]|uniref:Uncharacterized protein n=1 Tax=Collybia nuda TaxID=64659 RepID=A0A9P6CBS7_9AGAR|nr:hypothetical protein BDZ94DRAFT_1278339 [Collybia nuda]